MGWRNHGAQITGKNKGQTEAFGKGSRSKNLLEMRISVDCGGKVVGIWSYNDFKEFCGPFAFWNLSGSFIHKIQKIDGTKLQFTILVSMKVAREKELQ